MVVKPQHIHIYLKEVQPKQIKLQVQQKIEAMHTTKLHVEQKLKQNHTFSKR